MNFAELLAQKRRRSGEFAKVCDEENHPEISEALKVCSRRCYNSHGANTGEGQIARANAEKSGERWNKKTCARACV